MATRQASTNKIRGKGEGSVSQRPNGTWCANIEAGRDDNGKRTRRTVYGKTKREVLERLRLERDRLGQGLPTENARLTVGEYLDTWLDVTLAAEGRHKPQTLRHDRWIVDYYVRPHVGAKRLVKLAPADVSAMLLALEAQGRSPNTRRLARSMLRSCLASAVQEGLVIRNAAELTRGPKIDKTYQGRVLTPDEAAKLLEAVRDEPLAPFVEIGLSLGLRPGETLALRWVDIDLESGTLTVAGTLTRVPTKAGTNGDAPKSALVRSTPKTAGSRRTLPLPSGLVASLRRHRNAQRKRRMAAGPTWSVAPADEHLITTPKGTPVELRNASRWFAAHVKALGLDGLTPHGLRHSAASLLVAQGVPLIEVSRLLGHAGLSITADTYSHLAPSALSGAVDVLAGVIAKATK